MRVLHPIAIALALSSCALDAPDLAATEQRIDDPLLEKLQALPGVTVTELPPRPDARQFLLLFTQPVDHAQPGAATFHQRVVLRHRGEAAPTTLATTGYGLFAPVARDNEVSLLLRGNAITIEHRYFEASTPTPAEPRFLTIRQAAADHHRIVELLKPIYTGPWISTGASKGGMTSIYHRRFYPDDVVATVAYSAPHSYTTNDPRYPLFLERVGSSECRQRIIDFQRALLGRRAEVLPIFQAQAAELGITYDVLGGLDLAYEHAAQEVRFSFWQFSHEHHCVELPGADAPAEDLAMFLDFLAGPSVLASDETLALFGPYYYQAATQLGAYGPLERHLRDLLQFPGTYRVERYSTLPVRRYEPAALLDVQLWLATRGERIVLVYGEKDPWSAGAYQLGFARDSFRFTVPDGNHQASLAALTAEDRARAFDTLARWTGVQPQLAARGLHGDAPDDSRFDRERRVSR